MSEDKKPDVAPVKATKPKAVKAVAAVLVSFTPPRKIR
jgi:hypothetical protein